MGDQLAQSDSLVVAEGWCRVDDRRDVTGEVGHPGIGTLDLAVGTIWYATLRERFACAPWCGMDVPFVYSTLDEAFTEAVRCMRRTLHLPADLDGLGSRLAQYRYPHVGTSPHKGVVKQGCPL